MNVQIVPLTRLLFSRPLPVPLNTAKKPGIQNNQFATRIIVFVLGCFLFCSAFLFLFMQLIVFLFLFCAVIRAVSVPEFANIINKQLVR